MSHSIKLRTSAETKPIAEAVTLSNDYTVVMRKKEKDGIENNWIFRPDSTTLYAWALSNIPQERKGYWILLILFANRLKFSNNAQLLHFTFSQSEGDAMIKDRSSKNSLNLKWCVLCRMVQKRLGALAKSLQRASFVFWKEFLLVNIEVLCITSKDLLLVRFKRTGSVMSDILIRL